jgi:hypothetical protein
MRPMSRSHHGGRRQVAAELDDPLELKRHQTLILRENRKKLPAAEDPLEEHIARHLKRRDRKGIV